MPRTFFILSLDDELLGWTKNNYLNLLWILSCLKVSDLCRSALALVTFIFNLKEKEERKKWECTFLLALLAFCYVLCATFFRLSAYCWILHDPKICSKSEKSQCLCIKTTINVQWLFFTHHVRESHRVILAIKMTTAAQKANLLYAKFITVLLCNFPFTNNQSEKLLYLKWNEMNNLKM